MAACGRGRGLSRANLLAQRTKAHNSSWRGLPSGVVVEGLDGPRGPGSDSCNLDWLPAGEVEAFSRANLLMLNQLSVTGSVTTVQGFALNLKGRANLTFDVLLYLFLHY